MAITRLKGPINSINQVIFVLNKVIDAVNAYIAGAGTVTTINTGTGLTGGPITTTGTISIANTAVTPGSYTNTSLTVNAQGQLTAASSGTSLNSPIDFPAIFLMMGA